ncbi:MAG TPA: CAP domain-containing protein [Thermodesulfobacteriota bacterium]|nr:CAP domain-containing protein [Thermodesulfobacteriota bacterium]
MDRHFISVVFLLASFILFISSSPGRGNLQDESVEKNTRRQSSFTYQLASIDQVQVSELAEIVYHKVNEYRISQDLNPLTLNPFLSDLAKEHSRNMATGEVPFSHEGIEERTQAIGQKYSYSSIAENVGYTMGSDTPARKVVENWLKSPAHRKNISGDFELSGIGVARGDKGEYYFTQIFLKR